MWNLDWSEVLAKAAVELNLVSDDIKRDIPKFGTVFTQTRATYGEIRKQNSNFHKLELWTKSINDFGNFERHFPCTTSAKILAAMYARVPQAMAQFVLKIEKLSHIMAPTPILEWRALTVSIPDYGIMGLLKTNTSTRKSTLTLVTLPSFDIPGEISAEKM